MKKLSFLAAIALTACLGTRAQDIQLPAPQKTGGKPLMEALAARQTGRDYADKDLDRQTLSNLLWAVYGFNRPDRRTVPSSRNSQEYSVYVFLASGTYLYDAKTDALKLILAKDLRAMTGKQDFVGKAPLNLVFGYDKTLMDSPKYAYVDCGYLSQNVYLFCASYGLATVARGFFDPDALAKELSLPANIELVLAQTVGYPK